MSFKYHKIKYNKIYEKIYKFLILINEIWYLITYTIMQINEHFDDCFRNQKISISEVLLIFF